MDRRAFLRSTVAGCAAFALGLPAARLFAAEPAAALGRAGLGGFGAGALAEGLHFVDGWILTAADLRALADHEV